LLALLNAGVKPADPVIKRGLEYLRTVQPQYTYVVSLQTMVYAEAGYNEDKERIQNNVNWLIRARVMDGTRCRGWTYKLVGDINSPDHSNTQYALLGLHAGHLAGAKIDREVWESLRQLYTGTQLPDGSWNYQPWRRGDGPRLTMTEAGVCGLLISGMELNAGR